MYHLRWVQYGPVHPFVQLGQLNEVLLVHMDSILQFSVQKFLQLSNPFLDGKHAMEKNIGFNSIIFFILIKQYLEELPLQNNNCMMVTFLMSRNDRISKTFWFLFFKSNKTRSVLTCYTLIKLPKMTLALKSKWYLKYSCNMLRTIKERNIIASKRKVLSNCI